MNDEKQDNVEKRDTSTYYIDHKEFTREMDEFSKAHAAAITSGQIPPRVTESIGAKFLLIAENTANKYNFRRYTYLDEMILDAVENMVRYAANFDIELAGKSGAFSYFSRFAWYAFVRRIKKEGDAHRTKIKYVQQSISLDTLTADVQSHDIDAHFENQFIDYLQEFYDAEHVKNEKPKKEKPKRKKTALELRMEEKTI